MASRVGTACDHVTETWNWRRVEKKNNGKWIVHCHLGSGTPIKIRRPTIYTCTLLALCFPGLVSERENVPLPLQAINEQLHPSQTVSLTLMGPVQREAIKQSVGCLEDRPAERMACFPFLFLCAPFAFLPIISWSPSCRYNFYLI